MKKPMKKYHLFRMLALGAILSLGVDTASGFNNYYQKIFFWGNKYGGDLVAQNTDTEFAAITTGDSFEISALGDGAELHTDANAASIGNEADATTGWTQGQLDVGSNVFQSQSSEKSNGSYALEASSNDTPTSGARFYIDIGTDFSLISGAWYTLSASVRHIGTGDSWAMGLGATNTAVYSAWQKSHVIETADAAFETIEFDFQYDGTYPYFICREKNVANNGGVYLDAFSVKAASTITYAGGSELVTDPGLDDASKWTATGGWVVSGSQASITNPPFSGFLAQSDTYLKLVNGIYYDITFTVAANTLNTGFGFSAAGAFGSVSLNDYRTVDTHTVTLQCTDDSSGLPLRMYVLTGTGTMTITDISLKPLHDYETGSVLSVGGVGDGAVGVDLLSGWDFTSGWAVTALATIDDADSFTTTGAFGGIRDTNDTLTTGLYYTLRVAGTTASTDLRVLDATASQTLVSGLSGVFDETTTFKALSNMNIRFRDYQGANTTDITTLTIKEIPPILAKPVRVLDVSDTRVCTIDADWSALAANISSGFTVSADFTNYTAGDGWMVGCDVDPTLINLGTLTLGEVYYVTLLGTPNTFGAGVLLYDFFTSAGTETADATNTVVHITDTYAVCDGSQTSVSLLTSTEAIVDNRTGYKFSTTLGAIDAGSVTPIAGIQRGDAITSSGANEQNITGRINGDGLELEASTSASGVTITSFTIQSYE